MTSRIGVTGIGSLGHADAAHAVAAVAALQLALPFWPQLPRRGADESMVFQGAAATRLLQPLDARGNAWRLLPHSRRRLATAVAGGDATGHAPRAAGLDCFLDACATRRLAHVKGQWIGPATLLAAVALDGAVALRDEPDAAHAVLDALHLNVVAQARLLAAVAERVDLWLDEPLLASVHAPGAFDVGAARDWYARLARACGPRVRLGVHDCAGVDPALAELDVAVWSIDASRGLDAGAVPRLVRHLRRGWVAWGVVPALAGDPVTPAAAIACWRDCCAALDCDPRPVAARSLITPACGLAGLDPETGIERLRVAQQVASMMPR